MNNVTFEDLRNLIISYNFEELEIITKAYEFAKKKHDGQFRQSGEPYIIHPVNVAYILAEMHADRDTVCAGLLHDVLEDCDCTKEEIAEEFNPTIANLVDGVTKLAKMNYSTKEELVLANTRKIIIGFRDDVRIIIIKLADRLHNMRTLQYKSPFKQKENSVETLDIFVPSAYYIGAYNIKNELEDLSFRYLMPDKYKEISEKSRMVEDINNVCLKEMLYRVNDLLNDCSIPSEIKIRTKNVYSIYKQLIDGYDFNNIHDLLAMKVIIDDPLTCYLVLGLIHNKFTPIIKYFKDYIAAPKPNMYQSLHTTVFGPKDRLVQIQIRTDVMDRIANYGLSAYWDFDKGLARETMQETLRNKCQFYTSLVELDSIFKDNKDFVDSVKSELFGKKVKVCDSNGKTYELPVGSTPVDFAYRMSDEMGNKMAFAVVNNKEVSNDYVLQDGDIVMIETDELSIGPQKEWANTAKTSYAKTKIKTFNS